MKLTGGHIIFLQYLTNYNLKIIRDLAPLHDNFDSLTSSILQNLRLADKDIYSAVDSTNLAIEKLKYYNINAVTIYDNHYPSSIKSISDAPPIIFFKGNFHSHKLAAVVGSREVSKHGKKITFKIVDWLNELGIGVVSGLALGIDSFAHSRAIENKQYTIAVMPNALDSVYPTSNFKLANDILDSGGCLISELPFGINRGNKSFVQRNRLQAALSDYVIPIEMGIKSGTMHTIDFAKRYNKQIPIFKPTAMLSELPNYQGILHLINKPHKNQNIFTDKDTFNEIIKTGTIDKQIGLY